MADPSPTEEHALFIASLPDVFCDLESAIGIYSFVNRVASVSVDSAQRAIRFGLKSNFVESDNQGRVRLAESLRKQRKELQSSEGFFEVAVSELADRLHILWTTACVSQK